MALHRDIFWVGRQWAVTGHGMQAVDPRLKGRFDIEAGRLWDNDLAESLNAGEWLNGEDFAKALSVARARFPEQPTKASVAEPPLAAASNSQDIAPDDQRKSPGRQFDLRIERWPAKFLRPWRGRARS